MAKLTDLLFEILGLITAKLDRFTLASYSLVNKKCRAASESEMFHTVKVRFSKHDLNKLEELSRSPLAGYVRTLQYNLRAGRSLYVATT
jgi:hypothetical protein